MGVSKKCKSQRIRSDSTLTIREIYGPRVTRANRPLPGARCDEKGVQEPVTCKYGGDRGNR